MHGKPNLLLLDEPTNLDLDMRHALEVALQAFAGAVVTVSHDRHLIRATSDSLWVVADGRSREFDGDLEDYARWLSRRQAKGPAGAGKAVEADAGAHEDAAPSRRGAKAQRRRERRGDAGSKRLRDSVRRLESQMAAQRERLDEIERVLAHPSTYEYEGGSAAGLGELAKERADLNKRLEAAEDEWLAAAEALEAKTGSL